MSVGGAFLFPQVQGVPTTEGAPNAERADRPARGAGSPVPGEFDRVLKSELEGNPLLGPLKFSAHASQRMNERKIALDPDTMSRVRDAVDRAAAKGVQDTLVITDKAAFIVNVDNRTVVTAMDRGALTGNVFSNIDGAVIV